MLVAAPVLAAMGCNSGPQPTARETGSPATTLAGVLVETSGPPPTPRTPAACIRRWNAAANADARRAGQQRVPQPAAAIVRIAGPHGYFGEYSGRCLIYLVADGNAAVFVESAPERFAFTAGAAGVRTVPNARIERGLRLKLD